VKWAATVQPLGEGCRLRLNTNPTTHWSSQRWAVGTAVGVTEAGVARTRPAAGRRLPQLRRHRQKILVASPSPVPHSRRYWSERFGAKRQRFLQPSNRIAAHGWRDLGQRLWKSGQCDRFGPPFGRPRGEM